MGWRSKRVRSFVEQGFASSLAQAAEAVISKLHPKFRITPGDRDLIAKIASLEPAALESRSVAPGNNYVMESVASKLPPLEKYDDKVWDSALSASRLQDTLTKIAIPNVTRWYKRNAAAYTRANRTQDLNQAVRRQLHAESVTAGYLLFLAQNKHYNTLKTLFYKVGSFDSFTKLTTIFKYQDPFEIIDPHKDLERVSLSPIGVVHLFRQYFFELDTFLGTPVSHVWLSPGATVELIEVSTRKTITERVLETSLETTVKSEKELTEQEEISEAVRESNRSETKFGMNSSVHQGWISGHADVSANLDLQNTQEKAREKTHRHMRSQTEKLSTEIRRNFKSTFRTITETTDTSSKRYVLANTTQSLINYELRRKMRQVGVQVQDIGSYLCWQTFVDNPGHNLGVAKLVHLAKSPDLDTIPTPESTPVPDMYETTHSIAIPFIPKTSSTNEDDMDEAYRHGKEVNLDFNEGAPERIQDDFPGQVIVCDKPGYRFSNLTIDNGGADVSIRVDDLKEETPGKISFSIHLSHVNFHDISPINVAFKVTWEPKNEIVDKINAENAAKTAEFNYKTKLAYEKAFVEAARERIKQASNIQPRKLEELREEERIIVYRRLIQSMLIKDIPMPDNRTYHVVSELLNSIFDIDKMLYFVAPEWWRPRYWSNHQNLGLSKPSAPAGGASPAPSASVSGGASDILSNIYYEMVVEGITGVQPGQMSLSYEDQQISGPHIVGWGGLNENRVDNYYITDESEPAKLGSSLGWLLQLDGDNLRNAFLNAPWVKAVIPIRPGKEKAAMNWLSRVHVEGTEGLNDNYVAPPAELAKIPHSGSKVTVKDALNYLCDKVAEKHAKSLEVGKHPTEEINDDNKVSATPIDKVFEHGFYPLKGGFKWKGGEWFEVFDQWIEILPTDQVVPVEVKYDPKTGRQV